jgi:hypothetical protein
VVEPAASYARGMEHGRPESPGGAATSLRAPILARERDVLTPAVGCVFGGSATGLERILPKAGGSRDPARTRAVTGRWGSADDAVSCARSVGRGPGRRGSRPTPSAAGADLGGAGTGGAAARAPDSPGLSRPDGTSRQVSGLQGIRWLRQALFRLLDRLSVHAVASRDISFCTPVLRRPTSIRECDR